MEAPLPMVVPSRDSAPLVHPSFAPSSSSFTDSTQYGAGLPAHLWTQWNYSQEQARMESDRRREQRAVMDFQDAVTRRQLPPPPTGQQPIRQDNTIQPSTEMAVPTITDSAQEMPRNSSVDSAISMESNQGSTLTQLGMYTMHEKIGDGMYGCVRRAVHKVTKTQVAIKEVKREKLPKDQGALTRIYREIEIQKRLNHPFVLDIMQVMETPTTIYLVTQLCKGGELFEHIQKKRRLCDGEARQYFCQLAFAVQYCHERGVVHRDIKAENLLLDEFGNIKLADYGFSNFISDSCLLSTYCGSPQYAAPEVFIGNTYHGPELDIWSMGVALYVFLTGSTPFEGRDFTHIKYRVLNSDVEYPYYVSHEAAQLMNIMIVRDVNRRATLRQVMSHRWFKHNDIPRMVKNTVTIYEYISDLLPINVAEDCMVEMGITRERRRASEGKFDNVDGMNRLLRSEFKARRLRKLWTDHNTMNIVIAAQNLHSQGRSRRAHLLVNKINASPINVDLSNREHKMIAETAQSLPVTTYLPGPEEYPYQQFKEEEEKEQEENARKEVQSSSQSNVETLRVESSDPRSTRSAEIANFQEAQLAPARVVKNLRSAESSEGYVGTGETSAISTVSPSFTSVAPPDLRRMPSDVCSRMGALDITQKRRSGPGEQAPLPKRPSLPECLSVAGEEVQRGAMRLAAPPKAKNERKTFFQMMRLKRKKAQGQGQESGQSSSRPSWFLPPPALPEGGSFDDADDGKANP